MRNILLRFIINAIIIAVITSGILPGIRFTDNTIGTLVVVALIFGVVNALIKPVVEYLSCALLLLTLGLFIFVINVAMLYLTVLLTNAVADPLGVGRLEIENVLWAIVASAIISVIDVVLERLLGVDRVRVRKVVEVRTIVEDRRPELDRDFDEAVRRGRSDDLVDPDTGEPLH
ncbi:MAG: phage holin family protein [Chloroflexi bacterium]|nr:phage holin family protein [Chloroflexota bacterium]